MDGSTGSPTLFQAVPGETEIRGRLPPHPTLLSYLSSVFGPQHIIWRQRRDNKNSQLITDNSLLIQSHTFLLKRILAFARMTFLGLHSPVPSP